MARMSVGELARRVLPGALEDELAAVVRQLRHWTTSRVIPTVQEGEVFTGSGRHRGYDEAAVPLVAVAIELGRWRVSMEVIRVVLAGLNARVAQPRPERKSAAPDDPHGWQPIIAKHLAPEYTRAPVEDENRKLWAAALDGQEGIHLVLQIPLTLYKIGIMDIDLTTADKVESYLSRGAGHYSSAVLISLSRLFARLR